MAQIKGKRHMLTLSGTSGNTYRYSPIPRLAAAPKHAHETITHMSTKDDHHPELYPLTHSTAYLALAALLTIRQNADDDHNQHTTDYVTQVLRMIQAQPETVLNLPSHTLEDMGPTLLDNAHTWLND